MKVTDFDFFHDKVLNQVLRDHIIQNLSWLWCIYCMNKGVGPEFYSVDLKITDCDFPKLKCPAISYLLTYISNFCQGPFDI